jgi:hypothetical protein
MKITDDYSFVSESSQTLINRGLADLSVHSLNFDRYFTDEEMEHNREEAERLNTNRETYSKRCEEISRNIYNQLLPIAELLDKNFNMHQYTTEKSTMTHFNSDWDLFFYSNRGWNGKDYFDYMQISFNEKRTAKQNQELLKKVLTLLTAVKANNIKCRIQYDVIYHENEIAKEAASVFEKMGNKFIAYDGMIGKIKKVDDAYGFFKKGSKKRYYPIGNACMLTLEA